MIPSLVPMPSMFNWYLAAVDKIRGEGLVWHDMQYRCIKAFHFSSKLQDDIPVALDAGSRGREGEGLYPRTKVDTNRKIVAWYPLFARVCDFRKSGL